jgi:hypothetical protein
MARHDAQYSATLSYSQTNEAGSLTARDSVCDGFLKTSGTWIKTSWITPTVVN